MRLRFGVAGRQEPCLGVAPREIVQDAGDLGERAAVDQQRRHLAFRVEREDTPPSGCPLLRNEIGCASNGTPISWSAMCGAMELDPGAK